MNLLCLGPSQWLGLLLIAISLPLAKAQNAPPAQEKKAPLKVIVGTPWHKWLDEDVRYIITDQERADFNKLTTDKQRDDFIEAVWERRNPAPGSAENAFKEEHYRRFEYANEHFAAGVPGWKTDRGRFYIMYGPADSVESHPGFSPPSEEWHYEYIKGIGKDVTLRFVDTCRCGEYRIPVDQNDLQKHTPK